MHGSVQHIKSYIEWNVLTGNVLFLLLSLLRQLFARLVQLDFEWLGASTASRASCSLELVDHVEAKLVPKCTVTHPDSPIMVRIKDKDRSRHGSYEGR